MRAQVLRVDARPHGQSVGRPPLLQVRQDLDPARRGAALGRGAERGGDLRAGPQPQGHPEALPAPRAVASGPGWRQGAYRAETRPSQALGAEDVIAGRAPECNLGARPAP